MAGSRENAASSLVRGRFHSLGNIMDAFEDYVWPRATSELILLPVTGLECVGDRLLAGEAWSALVVLAGEELGSPLGGGRTGQRDARGRRMGAGWGLAAGGVGWGGIRQVRRWRET